MTDDFDEQFHAEQERRQRETDEQWLHDNVPPVFRRPGDMHQSVADWLAVFTDPDLKSGNLIMCGPVGVGKSWHLWRIVTELVRHHQGRGNLEVITANEFKHIAAPETDHARLRQLGDAGLLLFDDVGSVRLSEWDLDHLFGVIDRRWSAGRVSVIGTNALDLLTLFGPRIASRLADNVTLLEFDGDDRRRDEADD